MRGPFVVLSICAALAGTAAAEQTFPYTAYVTADDVYIRSGPGENYYVTDKLKVGTAVEVYRHDPGGWYAIRPPKDSFSWVSSRHLSLEGNNLATVTDERVASRVGSRHERRPRHHPGPPAQRRNGRSTGAAWPRIEQPRRSGVAARLVQNRAAGGRVPLGLRPLRRSGLQDRRRAADFR